MAGLTDYAATQAINLVTGIQNPSTNYGRWIGFFTVAPTSDSGVTGATECSLTGYARIQVAGQLAISGSSGAPSTGATTFTLSANSPQWLANLGNLTASTGGVGVHAYDLTAAAGVPGAGDLGVGATAGAVSTSTAVFTMQANSAHAGAINDVVLFSAWPLASNSSGSEPHVTAALAANAASIMTASLSGGPQTIVAFGIFDALTSGNLLQWDWIGNYKWTEFDGTLASPSVLRVTDPNFTIANGNYVVVTDKFGGTMMATASAFAGILTVAGYAAGPPITFNVSQNASAAGNGMVRQVLQQVVGPSATTITFPAGNLTITAA